MISTQVKRSWRKGMTKVWLKFLTVLYITNCLSAGILWILLLVVDYTNPMIHTVCTVNNTVCSICMQKWCAVSDHHSCWTHCCQYEKWCVPSSQMTGGVPYCKIKVLKNVQSFWNSSPKYFIPTVMYSGFELWRTYTVQCCLKVFSLLLHSPSVDIVWSIFFNPLII